MSGGNLPKVKTNGRELEPDAELIEVHVEDNLYQPAMCRLTLADQDHELVDDSAFALGATLEVAFGPPGEEATDVVFKGEIVSLECEFDQRGSFVIVRGYDKGHRLHRGRLSKSYQNVSDGALARELAGEAGLSPGTIDGMSPVYAQVNRINMTSWEFLKSRAMERGFELVVDTDEKLHFRDPSGATTKISRSVPVIMGPPTSPITKLTFGDNIYEFHARVTANGPAKSVEVRGWDWKTQKAIVGNSSSGDGGKYAEIGGYTSSKVANLFSGPNKFVLVDHAVGSTDEATNAAKGADGALADTFAEADVLTEGEPKLMAGVKVEIDGVGTTFGGKWTVTRATHTVTGDHGYRTHVEMSARNDRSLLSLVGTGAGTGAAVGSAGGPAMRGVAIGVVSDTTDPEKAGRVKLKLPWAAEDYVTDWVRVATPVAGDNRGMFFPLSVDDEVLVAFEHGDQRRPFVIGALYNGKQKVLDPAYAENGKAHLWMIQTASKDVMKFSSKSGEEMFTLDMGGGQYTLKMDRKDRRIVMHSDGKIEIDAKDNITIKGQKDIIFDAKGNIGLKALQGVKIEATSKLEMKGTAGVAVESSAMLDLKGNGPVTLQSSAITSVKGATVMLG